MNLETETIRGITTVRVMEEKLDSKLAPKFKIELLTIVAEGKSDILVNLEQVKHVDSSGLGSLLFGLRQAKAQNGTLKLVRPRPSVLNLIRIARLDRVFEIYDNEQSAIESFFEEEAE